MDHTLLMRELPLAQSRSNDSSMKQPVISRSSDVMGGAPVFPGTRVPLQTLLDYLEADSIDDFLAGFPTVKREQVIAFLEDAKDRLVQEAAALMEQNI
jgi:uncharacterized protein (DUF433 family)